MQIDDFGSPSSVQKAVGNCQVLNHQKCDLSEIYQSQLRRNSSSRSKQRHEILSPGSIGGGSVDCLDVCSRTVAVMASWLVVSNPFYAQFCGVTNQFPD
jgi:hypothetical protein